MTDRMTPNDRATPGMDLWAGLVQRVEDASGPDRELDARVHQALGYRDQQWAEAPEYTASLDAAMSLVPKGWRFSVSDYVSPGCHAAVTSMDGPGEGFARAATPARALVAACLRARTQGA